jgi:hypothetical protein
MRTHYQYFIVALIIAMAPCAVADTPKTYDAFFMPYAGYHWYGGDAQSTVEMGAKIGLMVTSNFGVEFGLDYIPTISNDQGTSRNDILRYTLDMRYEGVDTFVKKLPKLDPFGIFGISDDISGFSNGFDFHVGAGLRYPIAENVAVETVVVVGDDIALRVGLRKPLRRSTKVVTTPTPIPTPEPEPAPIVVEIPTPPVVIEQIPTPPPVEVEVAPEPVVFEPSESARLTLADSLYQFDMDIPKLVDMATHWAKPDATYATSVGLMDIREGQKFLPREEVTHGEMTKMVMYATYLYRLRKQMAMDIGYRVLGADDGIYFVNLEILDEDGKEVIRLLDNSPQEIGAHMISWKGLGTDGKMVGPGNYQVRLSVYNHDKRISLDTRPVKVVRLTEALFNIRKPGLDYGPVVAPMIRDEVLNKSRDEGIVTLTSKGEMSFSKRPVAKVEFAVSVAKSLLILGASAGNAGDFKANYRDWDQIPPYSLEYLDVYVSELGYGGTKYTKEFQPNKRVSRAEAAVLLTRLLNWKDTTE